MGAPDLRFGHKLSPVRDLSQAWRAMPQKAVQVTQITDYRPKWLLGTRLGGALRGSPACTAGPRRWKMCRRRVARGQRLVRRDLGRPGLSYDRISERIG